MCEEPQTEQQWYAIRVTYSREMAAKSYLDSIGIESYVPMHFAERTYGGKRRKVWEPLIHNLLFIRTSADRLREIKATTTLPIRYIMDRESKSPTVIPERQMQDFMAVVATQNEHVEIVAPQDVDEIRQLFQLIKTMLRSDKERYRHEIIRTLFTTAFYIITEINQREQPGGIKQGRCEVLFDEFMSLLQQYNKRERNVSFYAKQLNITPKYLSSVVKEVSGKTAARWIDESVILEAKALLKYSGMSIQEIAYHLNFSTQSFFGKYFKQHTGTSPSRYKRKG